MKKILFITHDTSRSGAPMVLLNFIRWLKKHHPEIKLGVVALRNGELLEEFKMRADHFYELPGKTFYTRIKRRMNPQKTEFPKNFLRTLNKEKYDLVYANTASSIQLGVSLKKESKDLKLVAHIHELPTTINLLQPNFVNFTAFVDSFIAVSQMVAEGLESNFSVQKDKIELIYEFTEKLEPESLKSGNKAFKVGAAGTFHWRKGSDVFLQVARYVHDHHPEYDIQFTWIGKVPQSEKLIAESDILKMGLQNKVKFTGLVENPIDHFRELDVFLLLSREDPFPLVCIEVGMLGVPIICFENSTGIIEVLKDGGGVILPYLDIEKVSNQIIKYFENPELLKKHGDKNKEQFSQFTPEKICPKLFEAMSFLVKF